MLRMCLVAVVLIETSVLAGEVSSDPVKENPLLQRFDSGRCVGCDDLRLLMKAEGWPAVRRRAVDLLSNPLRRFRDEGVNRCIEFWKSGDISFEDIVALYSEYKAGNRDFYWMDFRRAIAEAKILMLTRTERLRLVASAIGSAGVDVFDGHKLESTDAMLRAIRGGFVELEGRIRDSGELLERELGLEASDGGFARLIWEMRLRAGAETEADAEYVETERLAKMPGAELRTALETDVAFAGEVKSVTRGACGREGLVSACQNLARMANQSLETRNTRESLSTTEAQRSSRAEEVLQWVKVEAGRRLSAQSK